MNYRAAAYGLTVLGWVVALTFLLPDGAPRSLLAAQSDGQIPLYCGCNENRSKLSERSPEAGSDFHSDLTIPADLQTVLVRFKSDSAAAARLQAIHEAGGEILAWMPGKAVAQVRFPIQGPAVRSATEALATNAAVELVEPDFPVQAASPPNDPEVFAQSQVYTPQLLNLFTAWEYLPVTNGITRAVTIAVLDTGIAQHPEFADRIRSGFDFIHDDTDPEDDHGHGTHVAGIAAAAVNNGLGMVGVCGSCQILPVKVLDENALGSHYGVAVGIDYAVAQGADVIVLSLSSPGGTSILEESIAHALASGVFIAAAVGNSHAVTPTFPAAYPGVVAVSATNARDERWPESNYGAYVDVAAPGDNVFSTYHDLNNKYGGYLFMSGTSMATPFVGGLAGLLLVQNPERTGAELEQLIKSTALDLGEPGADDLFGAGRIDPVAALAAEATTQPATAVISGRVWQDDNQNNLPDLPNEPGIANAQIAIHDASHRLIALATTRTSGEWSLTLSAPAIYTASVTMPPNVIAALPITITQLQLTPTVPLSGVNFSAVQSPTAGDVRDFVAQRGSDRVRLSWTMAHRFVSAMTIERATTSDGEYSAVGSLPATVSGAAGQQNEFMDPIPVELSDVTLYYRITLEPGQAHYGPVLIAPEENLHQLFLPAVAR